MIPIRKQIHNNAVALISLFIAVGSLAYNTWRNETTEEQRNVRHASFRVLENLGELQQVVDMRCIFSGESILLPWMISTPAGTTRRRPVKPKVC